MEELAKLRQEHAELVKILSRLKQWIASETPPQQVELFNLRREFTSTLIAHLKAEDWVLYPRLTASKDAEIAATAARFNEEMGGLSAAFVAHTEKWTAGAISADWAGYCRDTGAIIDTLTNRITREDRELYPLLERLDRAA